MDLKRMTREQKEKLYKEKQIELHRLWENPRPKDSDFDFSDWTDETFEELIGNTIRAINREKRVNFTAIFLTWGTMLFVGLGVVGLLLFGIKQVFLLF